MIFNKKSYFKKIIILALVFFDSHHLFSDFNKIKFEKETLPNGLEIIYHVDKSAPVVATVMHYKVGSSNELPGQTGYAHFFEHLMFEATENIPRASIDKYIEEAGGLLNASTSFDKTVYYFKVPSNEFKLPLWIESQRMKKLKVDSIGVETQRGVVLEELMQRLDNAPYGKLLPILCEYGFKGTNYAWPVIGFPDDIKKARIEDFKNFYEKYYVPNNATLVIAGDFDINDVKNIVKQYFGIYKKDSLTIPPKIEPITISAKHREVIFDDKAKLPAIFIAYHMPGILDSNHFAISLLSEILARGESSRLYRRLVDKEQIAYEASLFPLSFRDGGLLVLYGLASPGNDIEDLEEAIIDEIKNLINNGISDEELTKAKNIKEAEFVTSKKNVLEKAMALAEYNSYFGLPELINSELDKYMSLTKADLIRVAKQFFETENTVNLIFKPESTK